MIPSLLMTIRGWQCRRCSCFTINQNQRICAMGKNLFNKSRRVRWCDVQFSHKQVKDLKEQRDEAYNKIRYENLVQPGEENNTYTAGPNKDFCRIVNCVPDSFIPVSAGETCPYFSFEVPCKYDCDCCNRAANIKYFEIKEQYDNARAAYKKLKARFFMLSK